jgi:hypothetical protein
MNIKNCLAYLFDIEASGCYIFWTLVKAYLKHHSTLNCVFESLKIQISHNNWFYLFYRELINCVFSIEFIFYRW